MNCNRTALATWLGAFIFLIAFISVSTQKTNAQTIDSTQMYKTILFVGHLNSDLTQDTVIGSSSEYIYFMPHFIHWGKDTTFRGIPDSLKVTQTEIIYPTWTHLRGSCAFEKINNDTLPDILITLWGQIPIDSTTYLDTAFAVVIFGQLCLDTLHQIVLTNIDTMQYAPYVARQIHMGVDLTECKIRDISYIPSYTLNNIPVEVDPVPPIIKAVVDEIQEKAYVKIYPNPANHTTNLEIYSSSYRDYDIQISSLHGIALREQHIEANSSGDLIKQLDLHDIASGLYLLRISASGKLIGTFQLIVVH